MEKLTIKRDWGNANINLVYDSGGIKITCNVEDFIKAFQNNIPKMNWDFKTETINSKCKEALEKTLKELKIESTKIAGEK